MVCVISRGVSYHKTLCYSKWTVHLRAEEIQFNLFSKKSFNHNQNVLDKWNKSHWFLWVLLWNPKSFNQIYHLSITSMITMIYYHVIYSLRSLLHYLLSSYVMDKKKDDYTHLEHFTCYWKFTRLLKLLITITWSLQLI